ncbi:hypothetical protein AM571_CH03070 [Rhizobium etli 8C-3]|uniref:DUF3307 domain-containing protein n=1 Tax=Rhizobium etli 8C-3 TaxID=538025 RepID=A0A1L5P6T4_RHIET|nr:DUF3307 domain-containing protein [Rhizobium etli]APO75871.1 hypothetical protein AM571_CH03070 [Rhizobium etli 8C-3]
MDNIFPFISLLIWLQVKHFVADYLLQPPWMLEGKGHIRNPGGYVHAAIHAVGSFPALVFFGLDMGIIFGLGASEFAIHYAIDHAKAIHSRQHSGDIMTRAFWAAHGADQLLHHLTYAGILAAVA